MPAQGSNGQPVSRSVPPGEETVIVPRPVFRSDDSSDERARKEARRQVALVEGSTPHLSAETRDTLRYRLRLTAILFFIGFSSFLVRWAFHWSDWYVAGHQYLFYIHALTTVTLGALAMMLCRRCTFSLGKLRFAELLVFGCPALFFVVYGTHMTMIDATQGEGHLQYVTPPWMLLLFTYALFIPNTWQRASVILTAIGMMPILILAYLWATMPEFQRLVASSVYGGFISGQVL